jgi:hypothetical protein
VRKLDAGLLAGSAVMPVAAIGNAGSIGSVVGFGANDDEAEYKQEVLNRWRAKRAALAKTLGDNYFDEGTSQQQGMTAQLRDMASGGALKDVTAATPDVVLAAPGAPVSNDADFIAAFSNQAGADAGVANANLAATTAATRRANFINALRKRAALANAPASYQAPTFQRQRFRNAMDAAKADADMQAEMGDVPNNIRNRQLLAAGLKGLSSSTMNFASKGGFGL